MDHRTDRKMIDSGVEWIGEIPEKWEVSKMKSFGGFRTGRNPDTKNEGVIPVYGSSEKSFDSTSRAISSGPAVCIGRKGTIDKPFFVRGPFWAVDTCMYSEVPGDSHSIDFVKHWLHIIPWDEVGTKTALPSLTQSDVNNLHIATPPLPLQQAIANYLDHHVGLIDEERELISKKIELLKEKRSALIFEMVTGKRTLMEAQHLAGVDDWSEIIGSGPVVAVLTPRADDSFAKSGRLVDSGVEWIGEMPEGWSVARIGEHASLKAGVAVAAEGLTPEGLPVYGSNGIRGFYSQWLYDGNYWIIGRQGSAGSVNHASGKFWPAEHALVVKHTDRVNHAYLGYALMAANLPQYIGGTAQPGLAASFIERIALPHPNLLSQQAIADFLDYETDLIDKEMELLTAKHELLSDKRKALIFEAVTGKIEING